MKTCKKGHQYDKGFKRCPECKKESNKQYRKENSGQIKKRMEKYREENSEKIEQYYKENAERIKNSILLKTFKIDLKTYNSKMKEQNFSCKICKEPAKPHKSGKYYILCVDHDHSCCPGENSCGKCIRGLICHNCNRALGHFKDNPEILYKAAEYLKSYEKPQEKAPEPIIQTDEKTLEPIVSS